MVFCQNTYLIIKCQLIGEMCVIVGFSFSGLDQNVQELFKLENGEYNVFEISHDLPNSLISTFND